ncbi:hypothetical protein K449DRAFT_436676 [Hypoxylon sp. EC38]|nr:hypothetical protein K449DRAFT_436676 [Hypoxylon sp. EC38]
MPGHNLRGRVEDESKVEMRRLVDIYLDAIVFKEVPIDDAGRIHYSKTECYFPDPVISFLIDLPRVVCMICREKLTMDRRVEEASSHNVSILPCGHVACYGCFETWLDTHQACPTCRTEMIYSQCRHTVLPLLITSDTICTLPKTLPMGGAIPPNCSKCEGRALRKRKIKMLILGAKGVYNARNRIRERKIEGEEAAMIMEIVEDQFRRIPLEFADTLQERRW